MHRKSLKQIIIKIKPKMKTKLIFLSSLVSMGMMLSGCTQFDYGFSDLDFFMIKYEDNFVDQVGEISPEQSWDFYDLKALRQLIHDSFSNK